MCRVAAKIGIESDRVHIFFKKGKMSAVSVVHKQLCTVFAAQSCQCGGISQPACIIWRGDLKAGWLC